MQWQPFHPHCDCLPTFGEFEDSKVPITKTLETSARNGHIRVGDFLKVLVSHSGDKKGFSISERVKLSIQIYGTRKSFFLRLNTTSRFNASNVVH